MLVRSQWPIARFPVVPGHEITGVVAATGPGVSWPAAGVSVGAQFLGDSCRHCDYCVRGDQILCPRKRITGIVMDGSRGRHRPVGPGEAAAREMDAELFIATQDADPAEALRAWDGGANVILNVTPSRSRRRTTSCPSSPRSACATPTRCSTPWPRATPASGR